jgi:plasmid stabilization system protein ParE
MSRLVLSPPAQGDIHEIYHWYKSRAGNLVAERLLSELRTVLGTIDERPGSFPVVHRRVRRALCKKFPYAVYFVEEGNSWTVIAVVHTSRHRRSWQQRM